MDLTTSPLPEAFIKPTDSLAYWNSVSADVSGMLGGLPQTSRIDLQSSAAFLQKLRQSATEPSPSSTNSKKSDSLPPLPRVVDCGAGIGRITTNFLLHVAETVDIVEPVKKFTDELERTLSSESLPPSFTQPPKSPLQRGHLGTIHNLSLQDFHPPPAAYNLIWIQWCLGHLTDTQVVSLLERCKAAVLRDRPAWIVVKENHLQDAGGEDQLFDDEDSSVTRSEKRWGELFEAAGLRVLREEGQRGFPRGLFPVRTWALVAVKGN